MLGIDLGTTNSLAAIFTDSSPQLVPNAHGSVMTPSVVGLLDSGEVVVGASAKELRVTQPGRCAWCFKRHMGSDREIDLGGRKFTAPALSSLVLKSLKHDAEHFLGESVEEAVITVPAYFNDNQRKATRIAGKLAGLRVRRIINEPTAAALVYGFHDREAEKNLCVIDLGGGTFDVTLMEVFEGTLEIVATAGESMLGGEDFTDRLVAAALKQIRLELEVAELKEPLRVSRLREECESAKVCLGRQGTAEIRIPDERGCFGDELTRLRLDAAAFTAMVEPLMKRILRPIDKVMRDAGKAPSEIDDVILVGGATRMPAIRDLAEKYFGRPPLVQFNPDEVVALGAAVQSALIADDAAVDDMVMTDVCPFTLGVEIAKEFAGQRVAGYFSPVIHRNTTIPVSREEVYSTVSANQMEVMLHIFQGESRKTKDNLELGKLRVTGLPPGPAGMPFHVRFTYDLNGILEVEAYVPDSGVKSRTVLTNHVRGLSEDELEDAVQRLENLKFYPRDELINRRLVLYCERVVGEVSPFHRQTLEEAIDGFENAMSSGDRAAFQASRDGLLVILSQLGFVYDEEDNEP